MATSSLYENDFYGWAQEQAQLLRTGQFHHMDMENLIEEIEDMGKRQKQELISRLRILLMHLLKWEYQAERRSRSWSATIKVQRFDILEHLEQNPSLHSLLDFSIEKAWKGALVDAEGETGIPLAHFPEQCPWDFSLFISADFWPGPNAQEEPQHP